MTNAKSLYNQLRDEEKILLIPQKILEENDYKCCWICGKSRNGILSSIDDLGTIIKIQSEKTELYCVDVVLFDKPVKIIVCKECLEQLKN